LPWKYFYKYEEYEKLIPYFSFHYGNAYGKLFKEIIHFQYEIADVDARKRNKKENSSKECYMWKSRAIALSHSRWRKLGLTLGIAKSVKWETELDSNFLE
jgi:hypothetical protein